MKLLVGDLIKRVDFFSSLEPDYIVFLTKHCSKVSFEKSELILTQKTNSSNVALILAGSCHVEKKLNCEDVALRPLKPLDLLGQISAATGSNLTYSVRADSRCDVLMIEQAAFSMVCNNSLSLMKKLAHAGACEIEEQDAIITRISYKKTSSRLAHALLDLAKSDCVVPKISNTLLAKMCACSRESMCRTMSSFISQGMLKKDPKSKLLTINKELLISCLE